MSRQILSQAVRAREGDDLRRLRGRSARSAASYRPALENESPISARQTSDDQ